MRSSGLASRFDCRSRQQAMVVGASLAGLMTSLALARAGWEITVLERAGAHRSSGAALAVDPPDLVRLLGEAVAATVLSHLARDAADVSAGLPVTWQALHAGLQAAADQQPGIRLHHHTPVVEVGQDTKRAWAITSTGRRHTGDLLIGADGYRSVVRAAVAPDRPHALFAGYVLWLGIAVEPDLGRLRWPTGLDIRASGEHHRLLGYPLPAPDGSRTPGARQLGWAWYDATRNHLLRTVGAVDGSVVQHSLRATDILEATYAELAAEAGRRWPAPWAQAIADSIARRAVTATPITEYLPDRLVAGRLVLVGDAAHVPTPMTGSGFAASLDDAYVLAETVSPVGGDVPDELMAYQRQRLGPARWLVQSGQQFSRAFGR